ncbi:MAG: hypothetical protein IKP65_02890 [Alphaproteobacteria bacterium]|nr:hypothetical protein [Alphaproteobacteria bacterium]
MKNTILTEWNDFKELDLAKVKQLMRTPKIIDLRHTLDKDEALKLGFKFSGI